MGDKEEFDRITKEIFEKLSNPKISKKFEKLQNQIFELIGHPVEINFVYTKGVDDYMERYEEMLDNDDIEFNDEAMTVKELINFLSQEDQNKNVHIDPVYLNNGVNEINNLIILDHDDMVLIVPKKSDK